MGTEAGGTGETGWRVAVTWSGERLYVAAGGGDGADWQLAGPDRARTWPTKVGASRVTWQFRRDRSWRQEYDGVEVEPVPPGRETPRT